jgi:hypothetical protein
MGGRREALIAVLPNPNVRFLQDQERVALPK